MEQVSSEYREFVPSRTPTARDVLAIVFRQWRFLLGSFVVIFLGIVLSGVLRPTYEAEMKILVRRERAEPMVSSQANAPSQSASVEVSEAELNSEVELLNSQDLLRKVVLSTGLQAKESGGFFGQQPSSEEAKIAEAVRHLSAKLKIEPLRKTNVISVKYRASDPQLAARVLSTLASLYVEKHLEVHRPSGEFKFFDQQTEQYRNGLNAAELQLTNFTQNSGVVSASFERDLLLQKIADFDATSKQTQAAVTETAQRIRSLKQQDGAIPARLTTQMRTSDNPQLMQQMKSTLLTLELKRTELLTKYDPGYRLVQEVDKQIAETRGAIAAEEKTPIREKTTDQNPTHEWVKSELAKAQTDLTGLQAKAAATNSILAGYRNNARQLEQASIVQQDLLRSAKNEEENYQLFLRKAEEARINDALDQRGILNVAVAEQPTVPALPARSFLLSGLLSIVLAGTGSLGLAFTSDFLNPSFRTPDEVTSYLGVPVLASLPKNGRNGNSRGDANS